MGNKTYLLLLGSPLDASDRRTRHVMKRNFFLHLGRRNKHQVWGDSSCVVSMSLLSRRGINSFSRRWVGWSGITAVQFYDARPSNQCHLPRGGGLPIHGWEGWRESLVGGLSLPSSQSSQSSRCSMYSVRNFSHHLRGAGVTRMRGEGGGGFVEGHVKY